MYVNIFGWWAHKKRRPCRKIAEPALIISSTVPRLSVDASPHLRKICTPNDFYVYNMDAFEIPSAGSGSALGFLSDSESASFPRKARSACTRCHSQKLRCVRRNDQLRCERCLKLKTNCRFEARASRASLNPAGRAELGGNDDWHDPVSSTNLSVLNSGACSNHDIAYINHTNWRLPQNSGAKVAETRSWFSTHRYCGPLYFS